MTDTTAKPAPAKPFDFGGVNLAKIADEPQELELTHPGNGEPLGVFLSVRGYESETFKVLARRENNAARKREFEAARKQREALRTIEDDEATGKRLTLALIAGWRTVIDGKSEPVIYNGGERVDFTPENAAWFLDQFDWVTKQVNEFASDVRNFTKG